jgi:hypothetical protein
VNFQRRIHSLVEADGVIAGSARLPDWIRNPHHSLLEGGRRDYRIRVAIGIAPGGGRRDRGICGGPDGMIFLFSIPRTSPSTPVWHVPNKRRTL